MSALASSLALRVTTQNLLQNIQCCPHGCSISCKRGVTVDTVYCLPVVPFYIQFRQWYGINKYSIQLFSHVPTGAAECSQSCTDIGSIMQKRGHTEVAKTTSLALVFWACAYTLICCAWHALHEQPRLSSQNPAAKIQNFKFSHTMAKGEQQISTSCNQICNNVVCHTCTQIVKSMSSSKASVVACNVLPTQSSCVLKSCD